MAGTRKRYRVTTNSAHSLRKASSPSEGKPRVEKPNAIWCSDILYPHSRGMTIHPGDHGPLRLESGGVGGKGETYGEKKTSLISMAWFPG